MTVLYLICSPLLLLAVGAIAFFTFRWGRRLKERGVKSGGALFGLYFISGVWMLMGIVFMIYGLLGVK